MEGTNPALENAHKIAQKKGFKGDINSFKTLISTNEGALGDVYNSVRSQGYNKDINSFRTLVGIEVQKKKKFLHLLRILKNRFRNPKMVLRVGIHQINLSRI